MYIKSMIIDGFKSFGQRTEINGFDCEFSAITGLNSSGKSNILDAICFVLGITNLTEVHAGSLQELVYKSGQAGITKASVTITFDNRDRNKSPLGYRRCEEITITRQAVVAGEDRYMINGSTVQNKCVNDMFDSMHLNVNNPYFLIMQGRITKVLNMKPPEILSLIEEVTGSRIYDTNKQIAQKIIEKKDAELKELSELINEEIEPKLTELREERNQYLKLQNVSLEVEHLSKQLVAWLYNDEESTDEKIEQELTELKEGRDDDYWELLNIAREVEHLSKILVTWLYTNEEAKCKKSEETLDELNNNIKELRQKINEGKHEEKDIELHIEVLRKKRDNECGSVLADLERKLTEVEKHVAKVSAKVKSNEDGIISEEKNIKPLEKVVKDDFELLNLEMKDVKSSIETVQHDIQECRGNVEQLKEEGKELATEIASAKIIVKELQVEVQNEVISKKNKEIQEAMHRKEVLLKELANYELQCTSLQHNACKCEADAKESRSKLIDMKKSHTWILENHPYFGLPYGIYDFDATDSDEEETGITKTRAMNILEKEEERYNKMMEMKQIIMRDREQVVKAIEIFDKKRKEVLQLAWEKVKKNFGSIFGSLLPGAQAKLKPPDVKDILDGLEVKVGFNGLWKDKLQELSDGQRSLVALSLILAILLLKPAPVYILDEVDAALDLSHIPNIGQMLKIHFKHSQFIFVSMKDGMFNNANVLFRTKFVDGILTVIRTTPGQN